MALNFPSSPTVGQQYSSGGKTWEWDGDKWAIILEEAVSLINWTIIEDAGKMYFKYSGISKFSIDSSGNLIVVGDIDSAGTP